MPIILHAQPPGPPAIVDCPPQSKPVAAVSTIFDAAVPERMRGLVTRAGQSPVFNWAMLDPTGKPVDLTDCGVGTLEVKLRMIEATFRPDVVITYDGTVVDAAAGLIQVPVDLSVLGGPGIFLAELSVGIDGATNFTNQLYVHVERGLFGANFGSTGPLTMAEIRLFMRDSSPTENRLLDTRMFDDAEIAACIAMPINYWNEVPPIFDQRFTTQDFPFRFHWLEGTLACLYNMAADWYEKNNMTYQAGGIGINDMDKGKWFAERGRQRWEKFEAWTRSTKIQINLANAWGSVGSSYGWRYNA